MPFRSRLKELIEDRGLTQSDLVRETGLNPTTIRRMVRGPIDRLDAQTVDAIGEYFKLQELSELIVWELPAAARGLPPNS